MQINFGESPDHIMSALKRDSKYLWVIDEDGNLVIGEEPRQDTSRTDDPAPGHPTLTRSRAARLGGEMRFADGGWLLNSKSGTYSTHLRDAASRERYLKNVIRLNFQDREDVAIEQV